MKTFKIIFKYIQIVLLIIVISIYIFNSGPKLPDETDEIIAKFKASYNAQYFPFRRGFHSCSILATSDVIKIWLCAAISANNRYILEKLNLIKP